MNQTFKDSGRLVGIFSLILLLELLFQWWLFYYSGLNLPFAVVILQPDGIIDLRGLVLFFSFVTTLIGFINKKSGQDDSASINKLTLDGTFICLFAEIVFQSIRLAIDYEQPLQSRFIELVSSVFAMTILGCVLSFLISYQIKTRRTKILLLFIFLLFSLVFFIKELSSSQ